MSRYSTIAFFLVFPSRYSTIAFFLVFILWGMRVAIYIFDLILVLLFFKVFFSKSYSISCPQTNCQRTFFTPTETLPLWTHQQRILAMKIVDQEFFSWCAGIKRIHWVPSQGCSVDHTSIRAFGLSKRRWFELMCASLHSHDAQWYVFSCSFFEFLR